MSYRYDVSYPFYDVAKRHGIEYGDVLTAAQFLGSSAPGWVMTGFVPPEAVSEIIELVKLPTHARGGRTDVCDACGLQAKWSDGVSCRQNSIDACPLAKERATR